MRAQAHTLEALVAALLLVGGAVFAVQATAVTPLTASTSSQHVESQQQIAANGLLRTTAANESLKSGVLFWNESAERFEGTGERGYFTTHGPPNTFGKALNETFLDRRIAVNVDVVYRAQGGGTRSKRLVYMGEPSDNAVEARRSVVVLDDDPLTAPGATSTVSTAAAAGTFYAPDVDPDGELFNVMEVRIVAWRI